MIKASRIDIFKQNKNIDKTGFEAVEELVDILYAMKIYHF